MPAQAARMNITPINASWSCGALRSVQVSSHAPSNAAVTVIEADVLTVDLAEAAGGAYRLVGNVPYYITTPILFHVLQAPLPTQVVLLVQREVAERIVAPHGSREYGALSVNVQAIARAEIVRFVPASSFSPPPKVESAVVRIVPREDTLVRVDELPAFRVFVQSLFGMRRKQMANVLRSVRSLSLEESVRVLSSQGINPKVRPEMLSPAQLAALMRATAPGV